MSFEPWLAFLAASLVLVAIPGPTVMLVVTYALTQGRRLALAMAAGVALGDLIAMSASLLGLGALVMASATLFSVLKWIGAAYLVWMGINLWRAGPAHFELTEAPALPAGRVFRHALIVTATNPKGIAFFIAFVPQFIRHDAPLGPQFATLIATFVTLGGVNALVWALAADRLRVRLRRPSVLGWLNRLGAGVLVAMGLVTATLSRR